jgi:hypothetical protein
MKIIVTRDTLGRGLGVLMLTGIFLLIAYLSTAWVWWQLDPGHWSAAARGTALGIAAFLLFVRWLAGALTVAPSE